MWETFSGVLVTPSADRAYQCLLKYALEPATEAIFNANSFGFRPGRSCHDVQKGIFDNLGKKGIEKRILELDIERCFDAIDHKFIMRSVQLPRAAKTGLFRAIKAGVRGEFPSSESGTPQGGTISPLLANISLHGLEDIGHQVRCKSIRGGRGIDAINGFRYADDVVFILKPQDDAIALREVIDRFLEIRGLKVKEAKTKLVQSTESFDFLGWTFAVRTNDKFISTPSHKSAKKVKAKVKEMMKDSRFNLEERIDKCGSIIRGWRNYHKYCDMSSHDLWSLRLWVWKFIRKQGRYNRHQTNKVIKRAFPKISWKVNSHIKVKGDKSPFDGDMIYWSKRENANYDGMTVNLLSKQKHNCTSCGLKFYPGDIVEIHHKDGNHINWKLSNLEVLHRECHQHQAIHGEVGVRKASSPLKGGKAC